MCTHCTTTDKNEYAIEKIIIIGRWPQVTHNNNLKIKMIDIMAQTW